VRDDAQKQHSGGLLGVRKRMLGMWVYDLNFETLNGNTGWGYAVVRSKGGIMGSLNLFLSVNTYKDLNFELVCFE